MSPPLSALPDRVQVVVNAARQLCDALPAVVAVGLVESWARGAGRPTSDVDLIVLTTDPAAMLESNEWFAHLDPHLQAGEPDARHQHHRQSSSG